jgi:hypothetical protein
MTRLCGCCLRWREFIATGLAAAAALPARRALAQASVQKPAVKRIDVRGNAIALLPRLGT